jgi:nucleoside-diphosphate-sugar epimerase
VKIALTGATGFVGQALLPRLVSSGHDVRSLTRRPMPDDDRVTWIMGDLLDPLSLRKLCEGCDLVLHLAGVIKGVRKEDFFKGNVEGTGYLVLAASQMKVKRFVYVSSLAARAPHLSDYAETNAQAESLVAASNMSWSIIRPCAVYGPGDRETLSFFKAAKGAMIPLPALERRVSLIHVDDLVEAIMSMVKYASVHKQVVEVHDGTAGGYRMKDLAERIVAAVGGTAKPGAMPRFLTNLVAWLALCLGRMTGRAPMLTPGKVRELYDLDAVVRDDQLTRLTGWTARVSLDDGLRQTASWYAQEKWL